MALTCAAFLGMSIDGFIAGPDGDLSWLDATPNPSELDFGFGAFIDSIDAIVMGRRTFETVLSFDGDWPYTKPLIVMSSSIDVVPPAALHTEISSLSPAELVADLKARGMSKVYVDGGSVVTSFLEAGLLDEITISTIPVALGGGTPLFGALSTAQWFNHVSCEVYDNGLTQSVYRASKPPE